LTSGFEPAFGVGALVCLAGAAVAAGALRPRAPVTRSLAQPKTNEPDAQAV
jgi:hypothetical protein